MTDRRTSTVLDRERISVLGGYLSIKKKLKIGALKLVSLAHPSATFLHEVPTTRMKIKVGHKTCKMMSRMNV